MPVQIGTMSHSFSDPTGLLSDCHRRVEMFMGSLRAVADSADAALSEDSRRALDTALRYFREAAPKHTADEEDSLFPRLRVIDKPELEAALQHLATLENDHRWAEPLHATVDWLGRKYMEQGRLSDTDASVFRISVNQLHEMYRRHIEIEDSEVFPIAARILPEDLKREIAAEMAARRALNVPSQSEIKL